MVLFQRIKIVITQTLSQKGKILLKYKNYTYSKTYMSSKGLKWICSTHTTKGCKCYIVTDCFNRLVIASGKHTHDAPRFLVSPYERNIAIRSHDQLMAAGGLPFPPPHFMTSPDKQENISVRSNDQLMSPSGMQMLNAPNFLTSPEKPANVTLHYNNQSQAALEVQTPQAPDFLMSTNEQITQVRSKRGNTLLMYKNYTYSKTYASARGQRWICSTHTSRGCKCYIITNQNNQLVTAVGGHNHHAPAFHAPDQIFPQLDQESELLEIKPKIEMDVLEDQMQSEELCTAELDPHNLLAEVKPKIEHVLQQVQSQKGNTLLLYQDYTYTKSYSSFRGVRWICSTHNSKGCKTRLLTDKQNQLLDFEGDHNHQAQKYRVTPDGRYLKIKDTAAML